MSRLRCQQATLEQLGTNQVDQEPDAGGGKIGFDGAVEQDFKQGRKFVISPPEQVIQGNPGERQKFKGSIGQIQGFAAQGTGGPLKAGQVMAKTFQQSFQRQLVRTGEIMGLF